MFYNDAVAGCMIPDQAYGGHMAPTPNPDVRPRPRPTLQAMHAIGSTAVQWSACCLYIHALGLHRSKTLRRLHCSSLLPCTCTGQL